MWPEQHENWEAALPSAARCAVPRNLLDLLCPLAAAGAALVVNRTEGGPSWWTPISPWPGYDWLRIRPMRCGKAYVSVRTTCSYSR